jgi:hypothetical protein
MKSNLPTALRPSSTLAVLLPSREVVEVPHCTPSFDRWKGMQPSFSLGGKPFVAVDGKPTFAELAILHLFEVAGWEGVCVQEYGGRKFYRTLPQDAKFSNRVDSLPDDRMAILDIIKKEAGRSGGCPDVFAWRSDQLVFCEAKRSKRDRVRPSQARWYGAALRSGVSLSSLLIAEWSFVP